jgi:hypothetical protein
MKEAVVNYSEIESGLIESYEVAVIFSEKESDSECNTNESTSDSEKENADWDDDKASDEDQDSDNGEGPGNKALSNIEDGSVHEDDRNSDRDEDTELVNMTCNDFVVYCVCAPVCLPIIILRARIFFVCVE